jgi:hypothetical protein
MSNVLSDTTLLTMLYGMRERLPMFVIYDHPSG